MSKKKNILIIITDQLSWKAISAHGDNYAKTPNIDRIIRKGVSFSNCYTPCPLCQPARAAFWTGLFPHQTNVLDNTLPGGKIKNLQNTYRQLQILHPGKEFIPGVDKDIDTIGSIFKEAGYDTVHFGKTHDAGSLRGFYVEPSKQLPVEEKHPACSANNEALYDRYTTTKVVEYLKEKNSGEKPYLLVADLHNPHNICSWIGENANVHKDIPIDRELPPLPDNFQFDDIENRPLPVQYICCSHNRQAQTAGWTEENYRYYLAAYYHYIETVDAEIGLILDALESREDAEDTLVVFMADHGEGMAAHGLVTKQVSFYEEITKVPFVFYGPDIAGGNRIDSHSLVSTLDLLPTLCDYSGIEAPNGIWGKSLVPWLREEREDSPHTYVVSQWYTEWGFTISPGRMIRTDQYKYMYYIEDKGEELYDIKNDPGEKLNLASNPKYKDVLEKHRELLKTYTQETKDPFFELSWEADKPWRNHELGYQNHRGPAAPAYYVNLLKQVRD